ncbi:MAG TPA: hypothetical protein VN222_12540, partial [Novosphingobium sp.]|nr:hypothetical protein [Novosphingobium sp.]
NVLDYSKTNPLAGGSSFSLKSRLVRMAWGVVWAVGASWTPRPLHPWRRFLLRLFGARMGHRADVRGSSRVWYPAHLDMADGALIGPDCNCYNQAPIRLGRHALISQGVHLCSGTHDIDSETFQLVARPIEIGDHAWIAADAFIAPGTVVGEGAVVGGAAVAHGRLEPWTVYVGNPCRPLRARARAILHGHGDSEAGR